MDLFYGGNKNFQKSSQQFEGVNFFLLQVSEEQKSKFKVLKEKLLQMMKTNIPLELKFIFFKPDNNHKIIFAKLIKSSSFCR